MDGASGQRRPPAKGRRVQLTAVLGLGQLVLDTPGTPATGRQEASVAATAAATGEVTSDPVHGCDPSVPSKPVVFSRFLVALSAPLFSSCVTLEHAAFSRFPGRET
eukprot:779110-Pyramimonas_sp.AAC.1